MFVTLDVLRASIRSTLHQFREAHVLSNSVTNALQVVPNVSDEWIGLLNKIYDVDVTQLNFFSRSPELAFLAICSILHIQISQEEALHCCSKSVFCGMDCIFISRGCLFYDE